MAVQPDLCQTWFEISYDMAHIFQGLSMSGADEKESQIQIKDQYKTTYPEDCGEVFVASDTWGALFTATPSGIL